MFHLFLQGRCLRDIFDLNYPKFSFGQVVHAAVEGKWADRRADHLNNIFGGAVIRAQQTTVESAQFVSDFLAATHMRFGNEILKYLQSGKEEDFPVGFSLKQYKEALELHLKVTGQDKPKGGSDVPPPAPQAPTNNAAPVVVPGAVTVSSLLKLKKGNKN